MKNLFFSISIMVFLNIGIFTWNASAQESFLLVDGATDAIMMERGISIHKRISPCSTFKIALSLMGYDAGILKDAKTPIWDYREGDEDFLEVWKAAQSPQSWMLCSCVWYSKELSLRLGLEKIQNYLTAIQYGNQNVSAELTQRGTSGVFWINSCLEISPSEQVVFIKNTFFKRQGFLPIAIEKTKEILFRESLSGGWKLFGKTGACNTREKDGASIKQGWFVGWIEKGDRFFSFAYLICDKTIDFNQRVPRVKQLLVESNVMRSN